MEETKEFKVGDRVYWKGTEHSQGGYGVITQILTDCAALTKLDYTGKEVFALVYELQHEHPKDTPEEHPITFYNIQDDIPIGGFAKVGNEVYKVVKEQWCLNCELTEDDFLEYKSTEAREFRLEYLLDSKFEAKLALYSNRNDPRYPEEYVEYKNWLSERI